MFFMFGISSCVSGMISPRSAIVLTALFEGAITSYFEPPARSLARISSFEPKPETLMSGPTSLV